MESNRNANIDVHDSLERVTALLHRHDALVDAAMEASGESGEPNPSPDKLPLKGKALSSD